MQCCLRGSTQLCIRKNHVQCCLNTLGITLHRSKLYAMLSEWLQTTTYAMHCCPMQCCSRGSKQHISQEKIQAIQVMLFDQHLVTLFTYVVIYHVLHVKKKIKLCFLYYENRLKLMLKQQLGILPSNFCQTLSKKVKLPASHAMLPKPIYAILSHGFCKVLGLRLHTANIEWNITTNFLL